MSRGSRLALTVAVLLLAAALRIWQLDSLPPGLYYDEAGHLLSAQSIGRDGHLPAYFTWGQGNEPLLAYLTAINLAILGPVSWAGRLVTAWAGLLSIASTVRAGRELFPRRAVGVVAGLVVATLFWHVNLSRYGIQPMLAGWLAPASVAALWAALRTGRRRYYALLGVCLGLGLLGYVAFRVFLLVPALVLTVAWISKAPARRSIFIGGSMAAGVSLAIFSPLLVFFVRNPQWFVSRFQATTIETFGSDNVFAALVSNTGRVVWGLFGKGASDQRQDIPGRPALDLLQSAFFALGAIVSWRRWRRPEALLAAWLVVGLLPSILTQGAPSFLHMVMAAPAVALLIALGATALAHQRRMRRMGLAISVVGLAGSAAINVQAYFWQFAHDPSTYLAYDGGIQWMAQQLHAAPANALLYETPVDRDWLTLEYTLGPQGNARFNAFNGRECFVVPAASTTPIEYAVVVSEDTRSVPEIKRVFPDSVRTSALAIDGTPYAAVYAVPAGTRPVLAPNQTRQVEYGGLLELLGDSLPAAPAAAGNQISVDLFWQLDRATPADLRRFVHVIGPKQANGSTIYAQTDSDPCDNAYPTWQWKPGQIMIEHVNIGLPTNVPTGVYQIFTGWYDANGQQRLTAVDTSNEARSDTVELGTLWVSGKSRWP